jgi:hypothetical protein
MEKNMAKFVELIGRTLGVVIDAETAMADWTPSIKGRLKKVIVVTGGIAATTLIENGYIKLSSSTFGGVDMFAPFDGGGLFTAPRQKTGLDVTECDLAIEAKPIRVYYYHNVIPTTPEITVFGEIEA